MLGMATDLAIAESVKSWLESMFPGQSLGSATSVRNSIGYVGRGSKPDVVQDVVQDVMRYMTESGKKYETDDVKSAFGLFLNNLRQRIISEWHKTQRHDRRTFGPPQDLDEAEEAGMVPAADDTEELKSDKDFHQEMRDTLDDVMKELPKEEALLLRFMAEEGVGEFSPDIEANMGLGSRFREWLIEIGKEDVAKAHARRWSAWFGETKERLLRDVKAFIDAYSTDRLVELMLERSDPRQWSPYDRPMKSEERKKLVLQRYGDLLKQLVTEKNQKRRRGLLQEFNEIPYEKRRELLQQLNAMPRS